MNITQEIINNITSIDNNTSNYIYENNSEAMSLIVGIAFAGCFLFCALACTTNTPCTRTKRVKFSNKDTHYEIPNRENNTEISR